MSESLSIFSFIIFILSIIVHEVAHGIAAEREGDSTARMLGRITLNPLKHLDWIGSVFLPIMLKLTGSGIIFGWAKPVPYNPNNLKRGNKSIAIVSIAGIVTNLLIAIIFALVIRTAFYLGVTSQSFFEITSLVVYINIILAFFNSIPIAPLDGFRFLEAVLPNKYKRIMGFIEKYSIPLILIFIFLGWRFVAPLATRLALLLIGA